MKAFILRDRNSGLYFAKPNGMVVSLQHARVYSTLPAARRGTTCPKARRHYQWPDGTVAQRLQDYYNPNWEIVEIEIQWKEIGVHA